VFERYAPQEVYDGAMRMTDTIRETCKWHGFDPDRITDAVIAGSGLGKFPTTYMNRENAGEPSGPLRFSFSGLLRLTSLVPSEGHVPGHARELIIGPIDGGDSNDLVIAQSGREHPYEGVDEKQSTIWERVMQALKVDRLIGSNAAGIVTPRTLTPPGLMLVMGDVDLDPHSVLCGPNIDKLGPRFPNNGDRYSEGLRTIFKEVAERLGIVLPEGIFFRVSGPFYESREMVYRMRAMLDGMWLEGRSQRGERRYNGKPRAVAGMSSTFEVDVARHGSQVELATPGETRAFGGGVAYVSAMTNYAAGLGPNGPVGNPDHDDVKKAAEIVENYFGRLVVAVILEARRRALTI
jgi:purine nucleoside phosphorylase